ncbi:MAG: sulfatase family protein, partial [Bryobacteraceae bacterium]
MDLTMSLTRKRFLQLAAASPALPAAPGLAAQSPGSRPNILLIMTDQHRRNYMTAAGSPLVPTPNIDRIAARGVRFTNAVCPYPVCAASRSCLLTGRYAHSTGVINNTDLLPWNTPTVAHHFADLGYHTGLIGKMHFNDGHT